MSEIRVSQQLIKTFSEWIHNYMGHKLHMSDILLEKRIKNVCDNLELLDLDSAINFFENAKENQRVIQAAAKEFSVNESYFFRDKTFFENFEKYLLPFFINSKEKKIHIWSVGCSRGEELYSIAILLKEHIKDLDQWDICLLGTDIDPDVLKSAQKGVFSKWSLRETPQIYMKYFKKDGNLFYIDKELLLMCNFIYHNLISYRYPPLICNNGMFDMVLAKNIMIYFDAKENEQIVHFLFNHIKLGGWFCTSASEFQLALMKKVFGYESNIMPIIQKKSLPLVTEIPLDLDINDEETQIEECNEAIATKASKKIEPKTLNSSRDEAEVLYIKAIEQAQLHNFAEAKNLLRAALYLDDLMVEAYIALGNLLMKENDISGAIKHMKQAKRLLSEKDSHIVLNSSSDMKAQELLTLVESALRRSDEY